MTTRSPITGRGSLRDRIAKFEATDGPPSSKPAVSPTHSRLKPPTNGIVNQAPETPTSTEISPTQDTPTLKTPAARPEASQIDGGDTKAEEKRSETPTETHTEEPPEAQSVDAAPSSLDALLSPVVSDSQTAFVRDPVPDSQRDDEEDDVRFSTVPLSGKSFDEDGKCQPTFSSFPSAPTLVDESVAVTAEQEDDEHGPSEDDSTSSTMLNHSVNGRKKDSVSSLSSVPFLINQLDKQEEMNDLSLGSNRQLREEFTRLQKQKADPATETEAGQIDWGLCSLPFMRPSH
jgi:hypothetical protein